MIVMCLLIGTFASACTNSANTTEGVQTVPVLTTKSAEDRTKEPVWPPESTVVPPASQSEPATKPSEQESSSSEPSVTPNESDIPPVPSTSTPVTRDPQPSYTPYSGGPLDFDIDPEVLYTRAYDLYHEKAIYISFDDGPSYLTEGLLDVLDQYHIKATFFLVYKPEMESVYKDIAARGHAIGIHCTLHDYEHLYKDFETWKADFDNMYNYLVNTIGYTPHLYRFPGGSLNMKKLEWGDQILAYLKSKNIVYWDWNVVTEDGDQRMPKEKIMTNAVEGVHRILPVILSHDGDGQDVSVSCIPEILQFYLEKGYTFRVLDSTVPPIQQGKGHYWDYYRD